MIIAPLTALVFLIFTGHWILAFIVLAVMYIEDCQ